MQDVHKTEIWLDTLNTEALDHAHELGILQGITTNPKIMAMECSHPLDALNHLLETYACTVAVQVTEQEAAACIREAQALYRYNQRILIKIPCIQSGYEAMAELKQSNIPFLATAIYHPRQFYIANQLGARYAAFYYFRMIDFYENYYKLIKKDAKTKVIEDLKKIMLIAKNSQTKLMAANLKSVEDIEFILDHRMDSITIPRDPYLHFFKDFEVAKEATESFLNLWQKTFSTKTWDQFMQVEV
ncbi:MAG TPA: transaldolase family protein [Gammaproteobacteria bacterium]|nr:transaldolase family protein [Gammaproteobacteria bacterium]